MNVLMVGVDNERLGGMWTVAENFRNNAFYNSKVNLTYIASSTGGSAIRRVSKMLKAYIRILKVLICEDIDIIHIHMAEKGSVFRKAIIIMLGRLFQKKVVVQMHAGPVVAWYKSCSSIIQFFIKKIFNSPDCMLVLGEYWKEQLTELVSEEKIYVLYNGTKCPETNQYNVCGTGIVYLGLIKKTKGTYDLVDAIGMIHEKLDKKYKVYLCGLNEDGKMLDYIKQRNLDERIVMMGWISKEERLMLFKNTRLVILPSYFEALSMTVIEAMSYGIPVITTNISTMPELLGKHRVLVTPGDIPMLAKEILRFSSDDNICKETSNDEYTRAISSFSIDNVSRKLCKIYDYILTK